MMFCGCCFWVGGNVCNVYVCVCGWGGGCVEVVVVVVVVVVDNRLEINNNRWT